jgi:hypothetical protein
MKKRKIQTPKDLHISYMCEYIDDYHDICKYAKDLIELGYKSKSLTKLSDINKNKDIKNFDKNYSEFIDEFELSEITYENAGLILLEILSKDFLDNKISLDEYMGNFYYLYYICNSGLQSKDFEINKTIRMINDIYKDYNIAAIRKSELSSAEYTEVISTAERKLKEILKDIFIK